MRKRCTKNDREEGTGMSINKKSIDLAVANDTENHEFVSLLRTTIKANIRLLKWLRTNKKDIFLFEDCFHVVIENLKDLRSIYRENKAQKKELL